MKQPPAKIRPWIFVEEIRPGSKQDSPEYWRERAESYHGMMESEKQEGLKAKGWAMIFGFALCVIGLMKWSGANGA